MIMAIVGFSGFLLSCSSRSELSESFHTWTPVQAGATFISMDTAQAFPNLHRAYQLQAENTAVGPLFVDMFLPRETASLGETRSKHTRKFRYIS